MVKLHKNVFTTAVKEFVDEHDNWKKKDVEVKGYFFTYKGIDVGVFNTNQENYTKYDVYKMCSGEFVAVIICLGEANGLMIASGGTRKEAIEEAIKKIDDYKDLILKRIKEGN